MTTTRKASTRTLLTAGALAVAFAAGSIGTASASPVPAQGSLGQTVASHELGEHDAPLTADQVAARQQLRTAIAALVEAVRAGDEATAQAALTQVMAATTAVKAADAAAEAARAGSGDSSGATDEQSTEAKDDDATEATDGDSAETKDGDSAEHSQPAVTVVRKAGTDHHDGQAHSAAWHNGKNWAPAHDSRDRHDAARTQHQGSRDSRDSRSRDGRDSRSHHGSHREGHHHSGR